jgi:hypothetical protein
MTKHFLEHDIGTEKTFRPFTAASDSIEDVEIKHIILEVGDTADFIDVETDKTATAALKCIEADADVAATEATTPMPDRFEYERPVIYYKLGSIQETIVRAEELLANTGRYFQRTGTIVSVYSDDATGETKVRDLSPAALTHALDGVSAWMKIDRRRNEWTQVDPVEKICNVMIKTGRYEKLPHLTGLARQPYLRPDGSLCTNDGYDPHTGLYGVFKAAEFDIPTSPTYEQSKEALASLNALLDDFAFASPFDRSAALSAMLTAAVRPSLALAPMFHVRAHQISSGKSYLCELITALATPPRSTPVGFPNSEDECTKLLHAQLLRAPAVIEFDNLTSDIRPFRSLCTALTSEHIEGRVLGKSRIESASTRAVFLSSGNNVGPIADMTRRCVTINLDPGCETPATRVFVRPNLAAEVLRERARYVSAALTVVRGWITAGSPPQPCEPLAGYVEWSNYCRQTLMWLDQPDPASSVFASMAEDPESQLLGHFMSEWEDRFGATPMMVRELVSQVSTLRPEVDGLAEIMDEIAGERGKVNNKKLGQWLKRSAGKVVDGRRIVRMPRTRNAENWRVESVVSVKSVSGAPSAASSM